MKPYSTIWLLIPVLSLLLLGFSGCYTQLGVTRDEAPRGYEPYAGEQRDDDESYSQNDDGNEQYSDRRAGGYGEYDDWNFRGRVGFSYYYPSYWWPSAAFSYAYADPWCYNAYWGYDPFWCGTPYYGYSSSFYHRPFYGYYSYPYYSYPYYSYYYRTNQVFTPIRHGSRDFGTTRGGTTDRDRIGDTRGYDASDRGGYNLPVGSSWGGGSSSSGTSVAPKKEGARQVGTQRGYAPRTTERSGRAPESGRTVRGWGSRGGSTRGGESRGNDSRNSEPNEQASSSSGSTASPPPAPSVRSSRGEGGSSSDNTRRSSGGRETGSSRGSTPQQAAPPSPQPSAPPQSSPPPQQSSGGRGSSTRGGDRP